MSLFFPKDEAPGQLLPDPGPQGPPGPTGPAGTTEWNGITGKPSTFAPSAHKASHATGGSDALTPADIGAARATAGAEEPDPTAGVVDQAIQLWDNVNGATALKISDGFIDFGPYAAQTNVATNFRTAISAASDTHTHAIADTTGLQAALNFSTAITSAAAPITAGSVGSAGSIRYDSSFLYICTATNTWRRTAITSW